MTALDRRAFVAAAATSIVAPAAARAKELSGSRHGLDDHVARGPQSCLLQCGACGSRFRAAEN
jgi:hypothetical protein